MDIFFSFPRVGSDAGPPRPQQRSCFNPDGRDFMIPDKTLPSIIIVELTRRGRVDPADLVKKGRGRIHCVISPCNVTSRSHTHSPAYWGPICLHLRARGVYSRLILHAVRGLRPTAKQRERARVCERIFNER